MKTFVFAIGGTGARILRSYTMLMAMDISIQSEIIPIIIDMDTRNGDTKRTLKALDRYRHISRQCYSESVGAGFFRNKFGTLGSVLKTVNGTNHDSGVKDSFQLDFGDVNVTFHEYIKGNQLTKIDNDLLASLFNDAEMEHPDTELNLKLNHGFKGNPNIGSVVFNKLINTPEFRHFENVFSQGDRIFILSSIFGGTGSSGFPQLVKNIRASNNNFIKHAKIGATIILPYFRVKNDAESSIDSDTFNSKTKSALTYYGEELDGEINQVYYLADRPGDALENVMGGEKQQNNAHLIELIAARAIIHFANKSDNEIPAGESIYHEYGIQDIAEDKGLKDIEFEDFYEEEDFVWKKLAKFSLFVKFYIEGLPERKREDFYKDLNLSTQLSENNFYGQLTAFINDYWSWLKEMERSKRSFTPFRLEGPFSKFFKNKKSISALDQGLFRDNFTKELNQLWQVIKAEGRIPNQEKFIKMMYLCIENIFNEYIVGITSNKSVTPS